MADSLARRGDSFDSIRVSDADRNKALHVLRDSFAAGRLTQDDFGRLTDLALHARTAGELEATLSGLPVADFIRAEYEAKPPRSRQRPTPDWVAPLLGVPSVLATLLMVLGVLMVRYPCCNDAVKQIRAGKTIFFFFLPIAAILWASVLGLIQQRRWARGVAIAVSILVGLTVVGIPIAAAALWGLLHTPSERRRE